MGLVCPPNWEVNDGFNSSRCTVHTPSRNLLLHVAVASNCVALLIALCTVAVSRRRNSKRDVEIMLYCGLVSSIAMLLEMASFEAGLTGSHALVALARYVVAVTLAVWCFAIHNLLLKVAFAHTKLASKFERQWRSAIKGNVLIVLGLGVWYALAPVVLPASSTSRHFGFFAILLVSVPVGCTLTYPILFKAYRLLVSHRIKSAVIVLATKRVRRVGIICMAVMLPFNMFGCLVYFYDVFSRYVWVLHLGWFANTCPLSMALISSILVWAMSGKGKSVTTNDANTTMLTDGTRQRYRRSTQLPRQVCTVNKSHDSVSVCKSASEDTPEPQDQSQGEVEVGVEVEVEVAVAEVEVEVEVER